MEKKMGCLLILLLVVLLAGCAREAEPQPQPTFPPPPDTPDAAPTTQPDEAAAVQETATAPPQETALPTRPAAAPAAPTEVTATPIPPTETPEPVDPAAVLTPLRLQNLTFSNPVVTGGEVTLADGTYRAQAAPGSAAQIRVEFSDMIAYGEVGGQYRAAVILITDGGGSGTFYTLHIVGLEEGQPYEMAGILLGDRVQLDDLAIIDGRIEVELTRAGPDDPLCCPTERVQLVYALRGDGLVLVDETLVLSQPPAAGAAAPGSTADLVERSLDLDVSGVAGMYAWAIERVAPQADPPLPAHLLMTFDSPTSDELLAGSEPLLAIYPVQPYLDLVGPAGAGRPAVDDQIARLWQLVEMDHERNGAPGGWMPLLPPANSPVEEWSDFAPLDFIRGFGVRYLRLVGGEPAYTYIGVTEDGRYAVSLTWPLADPQAPSLAALDAMIASLALGQPPIAP